MLTDIFQMRELTLPVGHDKEVMGKKNDNQQLTESINANHF
jgi:hypothetical protein